LSILSIDFLAFGLFSINSTSPLWLQNLKKDTRVVDQMVPESKGNGPDGNCNMLSHFQVPITNSQVFELKVRLESDFCLLANLNI